MVVNDERQEALKIRKSLWFGIPAVVFMLALSLFFGVPEFLQTVQDLSDGSPFVRVSMGGAGFVFIIPLCILLITITTLKAIPISWSGMDILVRMLNVNIFAAAAFIIVGVPALVFLQNYYLPKLGYFKCNDL